MSFVPSHPCPPPAPCDLLSESCLAAQASCSGLQFGNHASSNGASPPFRCLSSLSSVLFSFICAMASSFSSRFALMIFFIALISVLSSAQNNCNTQANPYCAGDVRFANLCCPSPSVCYFQDRSGTPGCCAAGQICTPARNNPQPLPTIAPNGAVSLVSGLGQITASMTMLTTNSLSLTTPAGAFSTVGGLLVGAARPFARAKEATPTLLPILLMAWHMF